MIPSAYIQAWSAIAPWPDPRQVEQDLIIIAPLLPAGIRLEDDEAMHTFERMWTELIVRIKGDAWKLTGKAVEELRQKKYPGLLRGTSA